jgi:hypothetical protein
VVLLKKVSNKKTPPSMPLDEHTILNKERIGQRSETSEMMWDSKRE